MKKAALYARVSTTDKDQNPEVQLRELREYCARVGATYTEYVDFASGATDKRPGYKMLINDATRRRFDLVIVWSLDRFGRSLQQLVTDLDLFDSKRIDFISHTQNLDTTTPHGRLLFQVIGAFAEFERAMISERVKSGLDLARANGKQLGRPPVLSDIMQKNIIDAAEEGLSIRDIAKRTSISATTVHRYLAQYLGDE